MASFDTQENISLGVADGRLGAMTEAEQTASMTEAGAFCSPMQAFESCSTYRLKRDDRPLDRSNRLL